METTNFTMVEVGVGSIKKTSIAVRPYFDKQSTNMGLEDYGMSLFDGVTHNEQLACLEANGVIRYITGLNEFSPEIKLLSPEVREARIREIRSSVAELEKELASNIIDPDDKDFWNQVVLLKPNNTEFWNKIEMSCGNEAIYLDPLKPFDRIKLHAIEAGQNLYVYGMLYGVADLNKKINSIAKELGFENLLDIKVGELSSGQKTRVSLGKAIINDPEILFLDEPTASLDPDTADRIRTFFEKFCKTHNTAIILASHNMEEVTRLCDSVIMMSNGKITDQGSPESLLKKYGKKKLEDVFLKIARSKDNL